MTFILNHLADILTAITSLVTGASLIAALTPTPADDNFIAKIRRFIDVLALNIGHARTNGEE
ncbi:MAG: hypothetical protein AB7G80_04925 [Dongiaceae bacterium]